MKDAPRHGYWLRTRPAGSAPVLWPSSKVFTPFLYVALYPSTVCIQRGAPAGKSCSNVGRIIFSFSWSTMLTSASLPTTISPRSNRPAHTHRGNPVIITPSEGGKAEGHLSRSSEWGKQLSRPHHHRAGQSQRGGCGQRAGRTDGVRGVAALHADDVLECHLRAACTIAGPVCQHERRGNAVLEDRHVRTSIR